MERHGFVVLSGEERERRTVQPEAATVDERKALYAAAVEAVRQSMERAS